MNLPRRIAAEALGAAFLLAAIVGSGIMGERLAAGNDAIALLANSLATGAALIALLLTLGPASGAHLNPLVTVALAARGDIPWREVPGYVSAQFAGALLGVMAAQTMFDLPLIELSHKARSGTNLIFAEALATFGLLAVVLLGSRQRPDTLPYAVAAYITAAYWFTASTSFANPAVTLARCLTDSFTGIRPTDVPGYLFGQFAGSLAVGILLVRRSRLPSLIAADKSIAK